MLIGELYALMTAFCWSGSSFAFTAATKRLGSLQLNINRLILAIFFLFITIISLGINFHQLSPMQIINLAISGAIGFVFGDTFLFKAYQHIGARIGMLLMSLSPVMSALLAFIFLHELISFWGIIGMAVTIGGVTLVVAERAEVPSAKYTISKIGIFYGIMGALGQAVGLIFAKEAFNIGQINGFIATFVRILSAVIILLPMIILTGRYKNPIKVFLRDRKAFTSTITGTILGPYFGVTFSLLSIEYAKVGIAATIMATVPIIMLPISHYIFKEKLSWRAIGGAFIAVIGVAVLFYT